MSSTGNVERFTEMAREMLGTETGAPAAQVYALLAIAAALDEVATGTIGIAAEIANK